MPNFPTRYEQDERDLDRVKLATQIFAAFIALWMLGSLGMVLLGLGTVSTTATGHVFFLITGLLGILSGAFFAYINFRSAQAIAERRDPHLSYFVAGMNLMAFPFGTILSCYTWNVLSRESVQELYKQGAPAIPAAAKKSKRPKLVASEATPNVAWHEAISDADDEEERRWKEIEAQAGKQSDNG